MKLGLFTHLSWPEGVNQADVFHNSVEQVQLAESMGYHSAWFAEHHFTRYSMGSSLPAILGHMAAATQNIRLGTGVIVPNLHHPISIAEDTATIDVLSNGRLDVGFGRGVFSYEYGGFKIPAENSQERFRETVLAVRDLWTRRSVSLEGEFHTFDNIDLVPTPVQDPHPPIYIAATRSVDTLDFLVKNGFRLCVAVVQDTEPALDLLTRYRDKCHSADRPDDIEEVPFFRYIHVADTEDKAVENTRSHVNWIQDIMQWKRHLSEKTEVDQSMDDWRNERDELPPDYEYIRNNRAFIGTPEEIVEKILRLKSKGITYFGCNFAMGGLGQDAIVQSMRLFHKKVRPLID